MYNDGFAHQGPGPWGWLFMVLVLAALVVGVVVVVRLWQQGQRPARSGAVPTAPGAPWMDPAVTELRMRYARGEIDWEEFSQRLAGLGYPAGGGQVAAGGAEPPPQPPVL